MMDIEVVGKEHWKPDYNEDKELLRENLTVGGEGGKHRGSGW